MTTNQLTDEQKQALKELVTENERLCRQAEAIAGQQQEIDSRAEDAGLDRSAMIHAMSYRESSRSCARRGGQRHADMSGRERLELVLVYLRTLEEMGAMEEPEDD